MGLQFDPNAIRPKPAGRDRDIVLGSITIFGGLLVFFLWLIFSPLHEGIMAQGTVVVEGNRKTVQHLEGGIVKNIFIRQGDRVKEGQVLLELEGTQSRATLISTTNRYWVSLAHVLRLSAIYNNEATLVFPNELLAAAKDDPSLQNTLSAQQEIFKAYQAQYNTQTMLYQQRLEALTAQRNAKESYLGGLMKELNNLRALEKDRLVESAAVVARQRDFEESRSDLDRVKSDIASTQLSLAQSRTDMLDKTSRELVEARQQLTDLKLQVETMRDVVARTEIRSPTDGIVLQMTITNVGQVLPPMSPMAEIVPVNERLVIEGMVSANDRPAVKVGQKARVTFPSLKLANMPNIYGEVEFISPDVLTNPSAAANPVGPGGLPSMMANKMNPSSFYRVRIVVPAEELKLKLGKSSALIEPGMPASSMMEGSKRSPAAYFLKPFSTIWNNSFTEQ